MKHSGKDILLLASDDNYLSFMENKLLEVAPTLKHRIIAECNCESALAEIYASDFKVKFINSKDSGGCFTESIFNLILKKNKSHGFINVFLEDNYYHGYNAKKEIVFESENRTVRVKKTYLDDENIAKRIVNTLTGIPPVYISYGNDDDVKELMENIERNFYLSFPHMCLKSDRKSVDYNDPIETYVEKLTQGSYIIILINKKYLESKNCMKEFAGILENTPNISDLDGKIYPIVTESGACVYEPELFCEIKDYWEQKRDCIAQKNKTRKDNSLKNELENIEKIVSTLPRFQEIIRNKYNHGEDNYSKRNFVDIFWRINTQLEKDDFISFYDSKKEMEKALQLF
ncbi:MAG: hypothetical protein D3923_04050 [Candidatus Electrothrix sp. AR3]|nr:hypothetical protein [Candidatus Electrothrix sp. AR3]